MEQNEIEQEIDALNKELKELQDEIKLIDKYIKKGMNNDTYKDLLLQKKELEKFINEVEFEIELLNKQKDNNFSITKEDMEKLFGKPMSEVYDLSSYNDDWVKIFADIESGVLKPKDENDNVENN